MARELGMLRLLKIRKSKKIKDTENIIDGVEEVAQDLNIEIKEELPPIKLFISVDQLAALNELDSDREMQARMFLNSKEIRHIDASVFEEFKYRFEKSFGKLGNENRRCPHCQRDYNSAPAEVKKCLGCEKSFFKTKRPQDGKTVLVKDEHRNLISLQWENIKKAELIERVNLDELEKVRLKLELRDNKRYSLYNAHFHLVKQYTPTALISGRFRLYSSFIYYMAEHDRYEKNFTKALMYYFYLYYLQLNGASNSVVFGDKVSVNIRIIKRISNLLEMARIKPLECKYFFVYSVNKTSAFEFENLPYSIEETYTHFVETFDEDERRKNPPKVKKIKQKQKSFRLTK
ncbi:MAG: hypothetical protein COA44_10545 [Arcobacter sp.]|nr:MAG: hypothetical protein COA44_10545 [Arcobacter sp.]